MANQFLTLSLFIMLLSFFIILNTMATYDVEKSSPIIRSLSVALSLREIEDNVAQSTIEQEEEELKEASSVDRLKALFNTNIAGFKSEENSFGTEMTSTISLFEFERALLLIKQDKFKKGDAFSGIGGKFVPVLISILKAEEGGIPYSMQMLVNLPDPPAEIANEDPEQFEQIIDRASNLSLVLEEAGMPKYLISSGLEQGDEDTVSLVFKPYSPYDPINKSGGQSYE